MGFVLTLFLLVFGGIVGFFLGKKGAKIAENIFNKKIMKGAIDVLSGEKKNETEINGKIMDVKEFIMRGEDNSEIKINLKGEIISNKENV